LPESCWQCDPVYPDSGPAHQQAVAQPTLDRRSVEAERLLARWGRLHAVRSVLSGVAMLLFLYLAIFAKSR
jgi:hypothetical protein